MIITIDGPSGSGKSTLAVMIAKHLHFTCLNSGYLYRGLTYVLKTYYQYDAHFMQNPNLADIQAVLESGNFVYVYEFGLSKIYWAQEDITIHLKNPEISELSAYLARHELVRPIVHEFIRNFVQDHDVVVEGRACGSVLFADAEVKFYLVASEQVRALRLHRDQIKRGNLLLMHEALQHIRQRDKMDQERPVEPLVKPDGAFELDSSVDDPEQVLQKALEHIKEVLHQAKS